MNIHEMIANAAADVRAMELHIAALQRQCEDTEKDNERLRKANAEANVGRMHAEADLIHYREVFVASVCIEAMTITKEIGEAVHENVRKRAEDAVQRLIEEKIEKDRELAATKSREMEEDSFQEPEDKTEQIQTSGHSMPKDGTIVQAPEGLSYKGIKNFYRHSALGYVPKEFPNRPIYCYSGGRWIEARRTGEVHDETQYTFKDDGQPIPKFLSDKEPKEDTRGGVSKAVLSIFGG